MVLPPLPTLTMACLPAFCCSPTTVFCATSSCFLLPLSVNFFHIRHSRPSACRQFFVLVIHVHSAHDFTARKLPSAEDQTSVFWNVTSSCCLRPVLFCTSSLLCLILLVLYPPRILSRIPISFLILSSFFPALLSSLQQLSLVERP